VYTSSKKRICISFDWHNDRDYRNMLSAWLANPKNPIDFQDLTPGAIDTNYIDRVKTVLTTQIRDATHTLVLVGAYANTTHKDSAKIGTRNWIWWEIEHSKNEGNRLIAVKLKSDNPTPDPLYNSGAKWAMSFAQDAIVNAINES
jgi:MTH538 TIR-like domain (DUF1863)